ncbi:MAG: hypothetical protein ACLT98_08970 [Eggerthellaceae bacterium]
MSCSSGGQHGLSARRRSSGANAVYLGCRLQHPPRADNFTLENLSQACDYAHLRGVSIYMTVMLPCARRDEAGGRARASGMEARDAFIVQDLGIVAEVKRVSRGASVSDSDEHARVEACGGAPRSV